MASEAKPYSVSIRDRGVALFSRMGKKGEDGKTNKNIV
jgi:hypothetical protein